jgi:hypothetical protein
MASCVSNKRLPQAPASGGVRCQVRYAEPVRFDRDTGAG